MKIITIVGARPQFVKAAVLSRVFSENEGMEEIVVHTGQHFDANMSEVFFQEMEIPKPKYNLEINSLTHGAMTGRMLEQIEGVLIEEKPDVVLVYGDTNSTLAGALAAKKMGIRVAHVEAGLRSFNMEMPEEINRILTDRISDYLFCPTDTAIENLEAEGVKKDEIHVVKSGDVMQDAAYFYAKKITQKSAVFDRIPSEKYGLVTMHRAENTNDPEKLAEIVNALNEIHQNILPLVLPMHPRTKAKLEQHNLTLNVTLLDPVGYFDMIQLIQGSELVLTDSGGLQKEAFFFQKKCVTMREQTEWVELIQHRVNILTGSDYEKIVSATKEMLDRSVDFGIDLYGNGEAGQRIADFLRANR